MDTQWMNAEKLAIPLFGTRVSPRFDCTLQFLLLQIDNGTVLEKRRIEAGGPGREGRIQQLLSQDVTAVVCGGIDVDSLEQLQAAGVRVTSWITGEAEDALQSFLNGTLKPGLMIGPGGACRGQWQFRHRPGCRRRDGCGRKRKQ